jgi:hypothetical protein
MAATPAESDEGRIRASRPYLSSAPRIVPAGHLDDSEGRTRLRRTVAAEEEVFLDFGEVLGRLLRQVERQCALPASRIAVVELSTRWGTEGRAEDAPVRPIFAGVGLGEVEQARKIGDAERIALEGLKVGRYASDEVDAVLERLCTDGKTRTTRRERAATNRVRAVVVAGLIRKVGAFLDGRTERTQEREGLVERGVLDDRWQAGVGSDKGARDA